MHIFHVMASGARGGGADHLLALLPALRAEGARVTAWVGDDGPLAGQLQALGVACSAHPLMGSRADVLLGRQLIGAARAAGAEIVHAHGTRAALLAAFGRTLPGPALPVVYSAHGLAHRVGRHPLVRGLRLGAEWLACLNACAVVSVAAGDLALLQRLPGVNLRPGFHVPNVVRYVPNQLPSHEAAPKHRMRRALRLPVAVPLVGTVSRLVPQKNVLALADAVMRLPGVHLVVVGDGPQRDALAHHPLAAAGRLHALGARDDVPQILRALDVFALSSRWEGEPIALLEAIAAGLPWVATRTHGAAEIFAATGTGTLVPQQDGPALAQALSTLLAHPAQGHARAAAGHAVLRERTPARLAQRLMAIYRVVMPCS